MAVYAIGDVQGCFAELEALLAKIRFKPGQDQLVFVGDLVNRGPRSLEVLHLVRALGPSATAVLGNHDLHLLTVAEGFSRVRGDDTLEHVLSAPDRVDLLDWLRHLPLALQLQQHFVVHAGLLPGWTTQRALELAGEVSERLGGPQYRDFLAHLYGSRPDRWNDKLTEPDRSRVIVNAMTRMRFCSSDGAMEFVTKGDAGAAPPGFMPWFEVPNRAHAEVSIVCGHWSALGLELREHLLAIDTGCVWGGALSAIRLSDRHVVQVPAVSLKPPPLPPAPWPPRVHPKAD
jgi:bis(5'-nucleosyl)-tetraphosphatase (symmetrical)